MSNGPNANPRLRATLETALAIPIDGRAITLRSSVCVGLAKKAQAEPDKAQAPTRRPSVGTGINPGCQGRHPEKYPADSERNAPGGTPAK